jgi:hypothetical protein
VGVEAKLGARDRRLDHVADRQHLGALGLGLAHRGQGVGGLARLADRDHDVAGADDRVAVAELAGESTSTGMRARPSISSSPSSDGVPRGAAGDDDDALDRSPTLELDLVEVARRRARGPRGRAGCRDRPRLLVDLLEHEVRKPCFSAACGLQSTRRRGRCDGRAGGVDHLDVPGVMRATSPSSRSMTWRV